MQSRGYSTSHSYCYSHGYTETYGVCVIDNTESPGVHRLKIKSGYLELRVEDRISEIKPVIAAELAAAGCPDDRLSERIARKVVLKQLGETDLDGSE